MDTLITLNRESAMDTLIKLNLESNNLLLIEKQQSVYAKCDFMMILLIVLTYQRKHVQLIEFCNRLFLRSF